MIPVSVAAAAAVLVLILLIGHFGLPERIRPDDHQNPPPEKDLLKGAAPYRLEGTSGTAFLMIHGYEGSPFTLRGLAEVLHGQGHTVIAPLLPGHGTNVRQFSRTRYEHWYRAVQKIFQAERPRYRNFFVVGFSMGGNLSLKLSIEFARTMQPTGLVLISTPVFLNAIAGGKIYLKDWRLGLSGIIKHVVPFLKKSHDELGEVISPWVGYTEAYTLACMHSFKRNLGRVRPHLGEITAPICLIQASNDRTVSSDNLTYIMQRVNSKEKRAFLFSIDENHSTRHVLITHEQIREKVYHYIVKFTEDTLQKFDLHPQPAKKKRKWRYLIFH